MQIHCSQCGREKREVNHWFVAWVERKSRFCFDAFDSDPAMQCEPTVQKICGTNCLHKAVEQHAEMVRNSQ